MNDAELATVTHVAAPAVTIDGRTIQRCAICGEKLVDEDYRKIAVPAGTKYRPGAFRMGALVSVDGNMQRDTGKWPSDPLPADNCLPLVET